MKQLKLTDLPAVLDDETVFIMRQMEASQSEEWKELCLNIPFELEKQYFEMKSKQQRAEKNSTTKELSWDDQHRAFWLMYVMRERASSDYTLEDYIAMSLNKDFYDVNKLEELHINYQERKWIMERQQKLSSETYTYFWNIKSPFSQGYPSKFTAATSIMGDKETKSQILKNLFPIDSQEYSSAEQFMMFHKAMIFLDRDIAVEIMKTTDVKGIKELGKKIKHYDDIVWMYFRSMVVYEGNKAKFMQNKNLLNALFETHDTTLVEAAPDDKIWGIGLADEDPLAKKRSTWNGKNLLGEILTKLRVDLMGDY